MGNILYSNSMELISQALDWSVKKQRLIGSNISNRSTPGYKAREFDFQKVFDDARDTKNIGLARTDSEHLGTSSGEGLVRVTLKQTGAGLNGNTVDLATEMSHLVENSYLYEILSRSASGKFKKLKAAIQGG